MMQEPPLFHRAKWTGPDRKTLMQEVMRGGDWIERTSRSLGRTENDAAAVAVRELRQRVRMHLGMREG